jgi:nitrogen regulatory protein PII
MSVTLKEVRSVRIVCDSFLIDDVLEHLTQFGATGYTWWRAHGQGDHPTGTGLFTEMRRVSIEVWCNLEVAEKIVAYCQSSQFRDIGMAVGTTPLMVPEDEAAKFTKE